MSSRLDGKVYFRGCNGRSKCFLKNEAKRRVSGAGALERELVNGFWYLDN